MRPLWWGGVSFLALIGNLDTIRDWWFPGHKDQAVLSLFPSGIPWSIIAWVGIILLVVEGGYRAWSKERDVVHELERNIHELTTPKLALKFDDSCIGPPDIAQDEAGNSSTFTRVYIIVLNAGAIPLTGVQVYCENVAVTSDDHPIARREDYRRLILGGSSLPRELSPKEPHYEGIVREIVDTTNTGEVTQKWIELQIPLKCISERKLYGQEFRIDVVVYAKEETAPKTARSYAFGWRRDTDEFFFESLEVWSKTI